MTALHINRAKEAHQAEGKAIEEGNKKAALKEHKIEGQELDKAAKAATTANKKLNSHGVFTDKEKAEKKAKEVGGKVMPKQIKEHTTKKGRKIKAKTIYIIEV